MLRIKYNNEFLDLAPDQDSELEANSPLFLIDNVLAEYSTPLTIIYSDKNVRLIGPVFFSLSVKKKTKINVEVYKDSTYRCNATLVIESAAVRRIARNGSASGYLLTGISSFFSLIKDIKLQDMGLGGVHTKPFTTWYPGDGSDGYWQWFNSSFDGTLDFVVAPIRNDNLNGDTDNPTEWMNRMGYGTMPNGVVETRGELAIFQPVAPQLKVRVAFEKIFGDYGWTVDSSALINDDFEKLVIANFNAITTSVARTPPNSPGIDPVNVISFTYADLLPKNVKASSFILAVCKRYGWAPICDATTKTCTLLSLKNGDKGTVKDWTRYAEPNVDSDFSEDEKIYSFKNNFTGNDAVVDDKDLSSYKQLITVASKFALPAPSAAYDDQAVFCYRENQWYGIDLDENNNRIWIVLKDNIYNDDPENATDSVETDCTTLPMSWAKYGNHNGVDYWGLFPYCSQSRYEEGGIRTLFYHGLVNEVDANGTIGINTYPYLSSTRQAPDGTNLSQWSNVFKHAINGVDSGIEQYFFAIWLNYMKYAEVKTQNFNLPLHELVNFKWNDIILINNIPHLVMSYIEKLSQNNFIQAKLKRLIVAESTATVAGIYVKIVYENIVHSDSWGTILVYTNADHGDVVFYCYADAAGTIPYSPAVLDVNFQSFFRIGDPNVTPWATIGAQTHRLYGHRTVLYTDILKSGDSSIDGSHWEGKYEMLPGDGYNIIP